MTILYLETNYLVGIATGRDPGFGSLPLAEFPDLRMAIASVCLLEALSWWEGEIKRREQLKTLFTNQIAQLQRDVVSSHARSLRVLLEEAIVKNQGLLRSIDSRLFSAIKEVTGASELIHPDAAVFQRSRDAPIIDEATDNLILYTILDHASKIDERTKLFLSHNTKEFGDEGARKAFRDAGIEYLSKSQDVLERVRTRSIS